MFKSDLLQNQKILVTGGGTGLGKSMAKKMAKLGAQVVICGRRADVLEATQNEFNQLYPKSTSFVTCDIRYPDQIEKMVNEIWSDGPLTAVINNAAGNFISKSEDLSPRALDAVLNIVLHGTAYLTLDIGKRWLGQNLPGNFLNIVTTYATTGSAYVLPSAMAKAGVQAMTRSLAVEWGARGIRCNAIAPGPFPTPGAWERLVPNGDVEKLMLKRIPLKRMGQHIELANLAAFLLSDECGYINGEVVTIDGGEWLKGAGQFSMLGDVMRSEDWAAMKKK